MSESIRSNQSSVPSDADERGTFFLVQSGMVLIEVVIVKVHRDNRATVDTIEFQTTLLQVIVLVQALNISHEHRQ